MFRFIQSRPNPCLSIGAILLVASNVTAQPNCLIYEALDCAGTPAIEGTFLDEATCISWLDSPGYASVLWDPDGAAVCTNETRLPVEIVSFRAVIVDEDVHLQWVTASETDNAGFEIEHRLLSGAFERLSFVPGSGTSRVERRYDYVFTKPDPNLHVFRLKQIDFDGSFNYSTEVEIRVEVPGGFLLEPAYPNPFNPSTTVRFAVREEQRVTVVLTDAGGRNVRVLYDGLTPANETQSVSVDGSELPSGSYIVTLTGRGFSKSTGVQLVK